MGLEEEVSFRIVRICSREMELPLSAKNQRILVSTAIQDLKVSKIKFSHLLRTLNKCASLSIIIASNRELIV